MKRFDKICKDIQSLKIQGATNVAKAGVKAYLLNPTTKFKNKLFSLRPTEPALFNALNLLEKNSPEEIFSHFDKSQNNINNYLNKNLNN